MSDGRSIRIDGEQVHRPPGDRSYGTDWVRDALTAEGVPPGSPGRRARLDPIRYDKRRYTRRCRIGIMVGRRQEWRRGATRYEGWPTVFSFAVTLQPPVFFGYDDKP